MLTGSLFTDNVEEEQVPDVLDLVGLDFAILNALTDIAVVPTMTQDGNHIFLVSLINGHAEAASGFAAVLSKRRCETINSKL
jgi:hypothetical protein